MKECYKLFVLWHSKLEPRPEFPPLNEYQFRTVLRKPYRPRKQIMNRQRRKQEMIAALLINTNSEVSVSSTGVQKLDLDVHDAVRNEKSDQFQ